MRARRIDILATALLAPVLLTSPPSLSAQDIEVAPRDRARVLVVVPRDLRTDLVAALVEELRARGVEAHLAPREQLPLAEAEESVVGMMGAGGARRAIFITREPDQRTGDLSVVRALINGGSELRHVALPLPLREVDPRVFGLTAASLLDDAPRLPEPSPSAPPMQGTAEPANEVSADPDAQLTRRPRVFRRDRLAPPRVSHWFLRGGGGLDVGGGEWSLALGGFIDVGFGAYTEGPRVEGAFHFGRLGTDDIEFSFSASVALAHGVRVDPLELVLGGGPSFVLVVSRIDGSAPMEAADRTGDVFFGAIAFAELALPLDGPDDHSSVGLRLGLDVVDFVDFTWMPSLALVGTWDI